MRDHLLVRGVDPEKIGLAYKCGLKFQLRNDNPDAAEIRYEIENTSSWGEFSVPPRGTRDLYAEQTGTVRLFHEGKLIAAEPNRGTTCPP
ncbi:MAG: hypothetical protein ACREMV_03895 [Gemmatimonadales bacterium]